MVPCSRKPTRSSRGRPCTSSNSDSIPQPPPASLLLEASRIVVRADPAFACVLVALVDDLLADRIAEKLPSEALRRALIGRKWPQGSESLRDELLNLQRAVNRGSVAAVHLEEITQTSDGLVDRSGLGLTAEDRHAQELTFAAARAGWRKVDAWMRIQDGGEAVLVALREAQGPAESEAPALSWGRRSPHEKALLVLQVAAADDVRTREELEARLIADHGAPQGGGTSKWLSRRQGADPAFAADLARRLGHVSKSAKRRASC